MHGQNCHTTINNTHCFICHDVGDGSTAALVNFSEFTELINNIVFIEYRAKFCDKSRRSFGRTRLTSCAREFAYCTALVQVCGVVLLESRSEIGVERRRYV